MNVSVFVKWLDRSEEDKKSVKESKIMEELETLKKQAYDAAKEILEI